MTLSLQLKRMEPLQRKMHQLQNKIVAFKMEGICSISMEIVHVISLRTIMRRKRKMIHTISKQKVNLTERQLSKFNRYNLTLKVLYF